MQRFQLACPILYGLGSATEFLQDGMCWNLSGSDLANGSQLLVVTDSVVKNLDYGSDLLDKLTKQHSVVLFDQVPSDPDVKTIDQLAELMRSSSFDMIWAFGGGSVIDATKLARAAATSSESCTVYQQNQKLPRRSQTPLIALPTTAGTGAEVTQTCVYTLESGVKSWVSCPPLQADAVVLDPALTSSMPTSLTVATGLDAFVHAFEAHVGLYSNHFVDALAFHAMRTVRNCLPRVMSRPQDLELRLAMQIAACEAGLAIDQAGTGIGHAFGHAVGSLYGIHHGAGVAAGMLAGLPWNLKKNPKLWSDLHQMMARNVSRKAKNLVQEFAYFFEEVNFRLDTDVSKWCVKDIVSAMHLPENKPMLTNNQYQFADSDLEELVEAVIAKETTGALAAS